jgi:hypothetical protein
VDWTKVRESARERDKKSSLTFFCALLSSSFFSLLLFGLSRPSRSGSVDDIMAELGLADTPAPKKAAPQRAQYAQPATHYRAVPTPQAHDEGEIREKRKKVFFYSDFTISIPQLTTSWPNWA